MRLRPDPFTLVLLAAIAAASLRPAQGTAAEWLGLLGTLAVAVLFFIHGAALSRDQIRAGATHWRLHLFIAALTFLLFPLLVLPIDGLAPRWIPEELGFLYLRAGQDHVLSPGISTGLAAGRLTDPVVLRGVQEGARPSGFKESARKKAPPSRRCPTSPPRAAPALRQGPRPAPGPLTRPASNGRRPSPARPARRE